jgi:hypothetical protein
MRFLAVLALCVAAWGQTPVTIKDPANPANPGTGVAPASTAATSGQPAVVVAPSPNTPLPAGTNALGTTLPTPGSTIYSGQQAVTGTAAALPSQAVHYACIIAIPTNAITIYSGPSGITTGTGFPMTANFPVCIAVTNLNVLYVVASTTGASVAWLAY